MILICTANIKASGKQKSEPSPVGRASWRGLSLYTWLSYDPHAVNPQASRKAKWTLPTPCGQEGSG